MAIPSRGARATKPVAAKAKTDNEPVYHIFSAAGDYEPAQIRHEVTGTKQTVLKYIEDSIEGGSIDAEDIEDEIAFVNKDSRRISYGNWLVIKGGDVCNVKIVAKKTTIELD